MQNEEYYAKLRLELSNKIRLLNDKKSKFNLLNFEIEELQKQIDAIKRELDNR